MFKKTFLPFLILLLSFLSLGVYLLFKIGGTSLPFFPKSQFSSRVVFSDTIGIRGITFNSAYFDEIAAELGIWDKGVYRWHPELAGEIVGPPEKVEVRLVSEEQRYYKTKGVLNSGEGPITLYSLGQEYEEDGSILRINLYFLPSLVELAEKPDFERQMNYQAVLALAKMSTTVNQQAFSSEEPIDSSQKEIDFVEKLLKKYGNVFKLSAGFFEKVGSLIDSLHKSVYAQTCTGGLIICGTWVTNRTCSATGTLDGCLGQACGSGCGTKDAYGNWSGTCNCTQVCDIGDDVTILCSARSSQSQCDGPIGRCVNPPYDCSPPGYGGSCSWSSGCSCTSWVDGACGGGSCAGNERRQTRDCTPDGCSSESRCVSDASCGGGPVPSCTVNLTPDTASVQVGSNTTLTASVTWSDTVTQTDFASGNTGIVTVSPTSDSTVVYSTQASGVSVGSTTVRADVIMSGASRCNDTSTVNVINAGPWWQVVDADITSNGDIISPIPGTCSLPVCNPVLGLKGAGGFPGVPSYGGATADFQAGTGSGNAAESPYNWLAASRYLGRTYDYAFFERQIPDDVIINELDPPVTGGTFNSGGAPSRGYIWYHWDGATRGDLTIDGNVNLVGSRRVVLMVEGANLIIDGRIQLQSPGQGFFMAVVGKDGSGFKGDILVDPSVDIIEGIFLAESEFKTGLASTQFNVRGSVAAYDGVVLERDLGASNSNTPAEVFTYAPDIIATFPNVFTQRRIRWKEVAP